MKQFDIIIPHFNGPKLDGLAINCLRSIRTQSTDYRVIWVQNGGNLMRPIMDELAKCEKYSVIKNSQNMGFVRATNQGIQLSDAPYIVLLNNDTEVRSGWLQKLCQPLSGDIGISGPMSTAIGSWQSRWVARNGLPTCIVPENLNLAFFCAMIRRDVIETVGLLDEDFGAGLGDDDDYCIRVRKSGYKIALVQDLRITHKHRSTFKTLFTHDQIHNIQVSAVKKLNNKHNAGGRT